MDIKQLVILAWDHGMGAYHDTKTSQVLDREREDFMDSIEDELKEYKTTECKDQNGTKIRNGDKIIYTDNPCRTESGRFEIIFEKGSFGFNANSCFIPLWDIQTEKWIEVIK